MPRRCSSPMRCSIASTSAGFTPAAGSSRRIRRGSAMRTRASSRSFRWPPERTRAGSPAHRSSPTKARSSRARATVARSSAATAPGASQFHQKRSPRWRARASMTFSSTVIAGNGRGIWKVRPRPRPRTRWAGSPSSRSPSRVIRPSDGRRVPATRLKTVVLPAPFGPIRPVTVPRATRKETPSTARWPPKRLLTAWSSSIVVIRGHTIATAPARVNRPGLSSVSKSATVRSWRLRSTSSAT